MPYKAKRRSKLSRRVLLPSIIVLLVVLGVGGYLIHRHSATSSSTKQTTSVRPTNSIDYSPAKPSDNASNEDRKTSNTPDSTTNANSSSSSSSGLSVTISANATGNKTVHVGTLVNGATTGTCTLTASQPGQQDITMTSSIRLDVNSYDCGPLNPQLSSTGTWTIKVTVASNDKQASASVTVNVTN